MIPSIKLINLVDENEIIQKQKSGLLNPSSDKSKLLKKNKTKLKFTERISPFLNEGLSEINEKS